MVPVLERVESRLRAALGEPDARASVTFLGTDRIEVLRFIDPAEGSTGPASGPPGDGPVVRYVTLGMSAQPMADPVAGSGSITGAGAAAPGVTFVDPERGPRAELLLSVRPGRAQVDQVLRPLAVLAAAPQVEGVVVAPGASLDLGEPLWPGAPFQSVLVAESGGLVADLELESPKDPVRFLPLLPMTPAEAAWKRVHGAAALQERWLSHGTDLRDPRRSVVPLAD